MAFSASRISTLLQTHICTGKQKRAGKTTWPIWCYFLRSANSIMERNRTIRFLASFYLLFSRAVVGVELHLFPPPKFSYYAVNAAFLCANGELSPAGGGQMNV